LPTIVAIPFSRDPFYPLIRQDFHPLLPEPVRHLLEKRLTPPQRPEGLFIHHEVNLLAQAQERLGDGQRGQVSAHHEHRIHLRNFLPPDSGLFQRFEGEENVPEVQKRFRDSRFSAYSKDEAAEPEHFLVIQNEFSFAGIQGDHLLPVPEFYGHVPVLFHRTHIEGLFLDVAADPLGQEMGPVTPVRFLADQGDARSRRLEPQGHCGVVTCRTVSDHDEMLVRHGPLPAPFAL
jgi:hypothetical protein